MSALDRDDGHSEILVEELVARWQESRERGEVIDLRMLCRDRPGLMEEVERRICVLNAWDRFTETVRDSGAEAVPPQRPGQPAPGAAQVQLDLSNLRFFAKGGLGVIYSGHDRNLGRDLAVKFAAAPAGTCTEAEVNRRFLREVKVTAALEHPGIVPVHGLGQDPQGRPCYAMRLIAGKSLGKAVSEFHATRLGVAARRRVELRRDPRFRSLLQRLKAACVTVAYAHSRGFLHRDLKPDHILLGDFESTWVVDWGLTKPLADTEATPWQLSPMAPPRRESSTHTGLGTLGFASPEQQSGDWSRAGPTSDVYSLGAILYVVLTDRPPFTGRSTAEIVRLVETGAFAPPRKRNPEIPHDLEAICLRAMAFRPEDRYATAQALADDIERWLADSPVEAYREPWTTRARRVVGRHVLVLLLLLGAITGGIVTAATGWWSNRLRDVELRSIAYTTAERAAREQVVAHQPGWIERSLDRVAEAARTESSLRSAPVLRSLAASCFQGFDLRPLARLTTAPAGGLAFSPDGRRMIVGGLSGADAYRFQLLEVDSGRVLREHVLPIGAAPKTKGTPAVAFSPDGRWLGAGLRDGRIMAWSATDAHSVPAEVGRCESCVVGLRFTPDGNSLLAASKDGTLLLADWTTRGGWTLIRRVRCLPVIRDMALGSDGLRVACVGARGLISVEVSTLRESGRLPAPDQSPGIGECVAIAPDGRRIALASLNHLALRIDSNPTATGLVDPDLGVVHQDEMARMEFSPDGTLLVSGSDDNTVKLWDLAAFRMVLRQQVVSASTVIPIFNPAGDRLAVGTSEGVWLFELLGGSVCRALAVGPGVVSDLAFLHDGQPDRASVETLLVTSRDANGSDDPGVQMIETWPYTLGRPTEHSPLKTAGPIDHPLALEANPAGRQLAVAVRSGGWFLDMSRDPVSRHLAPIDDTSALTFSADGESLWILTRDDAIVSVASDGSGATRRWKSQEARDPRGMARVSCLSAVRDRAVAGTLTGGVLLSEAADARFEPVATASGPIESIALSPDESQVACGTRRGGLDLLRLRDSRLIFHAEAHADRIQQVRFHPSGRYLATLARDRNVIVWDVEGDVIRELFRITSPYRLAPSRLRFSPDGRQLGVLFAGAHAVHVWDLDGLRREFERLGLGWDGPPFGVKPDADAVPRRPSP